MKLSDYFDFYFENPLATYNKIKQYFRPLKTKWSLYKGAGREAKILSISS